MINIISVNLYKFLNHRWVKAIKLGLLNIQPIILTYCLLVVMIHMPFTFYKSIMEELIGIDWKENLWGIYRIVYNVSKYSLVVTISYSLAKLKNANSIKKVNPLIVGVVGLLSVGILTIDIQNIVTLKEGLASKVSFISIIYCIICTEFFITIYKCLDNRYHLLTLAYNKILRESIKSFIPLGLTLCLMVILENFFIEIVVIIELIMYEFQRLILETVNNSLLKDLGYVLLKQIIWLLGGHGGDIIQIGNDVNKLYIDVFVNIGGAGATLAMIFSILLSKSSSDEKSISKISIIPSVFNINEVMIYGIPIVFNPIYFIPFILVPIVLMLITSIAVNLEFIEIVNFNNVWSYPVIINSYNLTQNINGVILQVINMIIAAFIYLPFVRLSNIVSENEVRSNFEKLKTDLFNGNIDSKKVLTRDDSYGDVARRLAVSIYDNLENNKDIYLEYQPIVNSEGKVKSVEALFRLNHDILGYIPPNIAISIAEDAKIIRELGKWIVNKACEDYKTWISDIPQDITLSINISTIQLKDETLVDYISNTLNKYNIKPSKIKLEITETHKINDDSISKEQLRRLDELGIKLVIDDFGVGYNPILYIKNYTISCLKIDGSLIKDIEVNKESKEIVTAMYNLCKSSSIDIVYEYVENINQRKILDTIGYGMYQGYLYSKPLNTHECYKYIMLNRSSE